MATESAQYLLKLLSLTSCTVSGDVTGHGVNTLALETGVEQEQSKLHCTKALPRQAPWRHLLHLGLAQSKPG